jgi:hypothetical protein
LLTLKLELSSEYSLPLLLLLLLDLTPVGRMKWTKEEGKRYRED